MSWNNDQISEEIEKMEQETKAYRNEALRLCWYMRGSLSYSDAMLLSVNDREIINKIIKDNIETTEKSGLPFF